MLRIASSYSLAVELYAMQQGVISLTGRQTLAGLTLVMTPETQGDGLVCSGNVRRISAYEEA